METSRPADGWVANLNNSHALGHPIRRWRMIETHISWIILTGDFAYKIKKPVAFGFLDFSTLAQRHFYCLEELRLNRRFAPEIYLDLVEIRGSFGQPRLYGDGEVIEYAVKMREFSQQDLLSVRAAEGELDPALIDAMAQRISDVHAACAKAPADSHYGSVDVTRRWCNENLTHLAATVPVDLMPPAYQRLCEWYRLNQNLETVIERRKTEGCVRECHGDLHLGNMALIDQRVTLFDCLEFNPELRWIDTISEAAFVAMDLHARGYPACGWRFINRYLQASGDYAGIALLRYYVIYRALVRAKVEALRAEQANNDPQAQADKLRPAFDYIDLADRWAHGHGAGLIIMHGLSGSGKSTVAAKLAATLGAIQIRSDVERKRLFGFSAEADTASAVDGGIYTADAGQSTYAHLRALAQRVVDADFCAIVDATFLQKAQRKAFLSLANSRFKCVIVSCEAPRAELERRIGARGQDASEANLEVLRRQFENYAPLGADELERASLVRVDAAGLREAQVEQIRLRLVS